MSPKCLNREQVEHSKSVLGEGTVDMLFQVHRDALWLLENLGVGCRRRQMVQAFKALEASGEVITYENRVYLSPSLVERCLQSVPPSADFFVPRNSFFVGGTAPYIYDDEKGEGGKPPTADDVRRIAQIADSSGQIAGMGRGVKLKNEAEQMNIMAQWCRKPLYVAVTNDESLERARELHAERGNIIIVFCLTRPPLEVNENFADSFVKVVQAGLPVFISAMPLAGISAPFCYNGVLSMTHAEVLFGICAAQLLNPGTVCIHAGYPTIADPRIEYNPNYGLISHNLLNILMAHLNMMLDLPTFQSAGTTHEEHPTPKALEDSRTGLALCRKYGVHMIRHPFGFLRYLVDFSIAKLEKAAQLAAEVGGADAPDVKMPLYDERAMRSFENIGLGMYRDDPLTLANFGKVFVE